MNKRLIIIITIVSLSFSLKAQTWNTIPSSGFEDIINYNYNQNDVIENYITHWFATCGEPDVFSTNNNFGQFIVPLNGNLAYFQHPHGGNAFIGLGLYNKPFDTSQYKNMREAIGVKLSQKLKIGFQYYYEYYVNFSGSNWDLTAGRNNYPIKKHCAFNLR
jgi:hypothetical protein